MDKDELTWMSIVIFILKIDNKCYEFPSCPREDEIGKDLYKYLCKNVNKLILRVNI